MCAVIGTVIGSGIFFKSEEILNITNGNVLLGLLALAVGGGVMLICASAFASLSGGRGAELGVPGYAEETCGLGYARFAAIFSADFYLPSMTATLAWVSGRYFCVLLGMDGSVSAEIAVSGFFLILSFSVNTLSLAAARKIQVVTTVLKLLPVLAVGMIGGVFFVREPVLAELNVSGGSSGFMSALLSATFAYEGWIAVTTLGKGARNAEKNIPFALFFGSLTVLFVYLFYYFGVIAVSGGEAAQAFETIFGASGGRVMLIFVTLSCLGALNGLTMSTVRGHYILTQCFRGKDNSVGILAQTCGDDEIPMPSGIMGLFISELWLIITVFIKNGMLDFGIDFAEASISVMYAIYLPIFAVTALKRGIRGVLLPLSAFAAALPIALAAFLSFGYSMVAFLLAVAAVSLGVFGLYRR